MLKKLHKLFDNKSNIEDGLVNGFVTQSDGASGERLQLTSVEPTIRVLPTGSGSIPLSCKVCRVSNLTN
jgi:hypothetical protein